MQKARCQSGLCGTSSLGRNPRIRWILPKMQSRKGASRKAHADPRGKTVSECIESLVMEIQRRPRNRKSITRPELSGGTIPDRIGGKPGKSTTRFMELQPSRGNNLEHKMSGSKGEY